MEEKDFGLLEWLVTSPLETILSIAFGIFGVYLSLSGDNSDPSLQTWMIVISPFVAFGFSYLLFFLFMRIFKFVSGMLGPIIGFIIALAGSVTLLLEPARNAGAEFMTNAIVIGYTLLGFALLLVQIKAFLREL